MIYRTILIIYLRRVAGPLYLHFFSISFPTKATYFPMNVYNFLTSPITDALGWTLLHAIWQGFALVLPAAVLLYFLRHRSGILRYRVGVFTLLAQVLASAGTFFWYYQPVSATQPLSPAYAAWYAPQIRWQTVAQSIPWHQQTQQFLENHLSQFVLIYLIGVAMFGLRLAGGWIYLQQLSKTATLPASQHWLKLTNQIRFTLSIRAVVQVRESARIAMPMVVGVLKPVLLLPFGLATHLSTREIEAVLAHELAHIKRHDYAVNLLQSVVEVLYFFHPALWWLSARVREEREHCCDDLAVQVCGGNGRILAQALAHVEELRLIQSAQTPVLAMAFAAKRQHLLHRVQRVLGVPTRPFVSNSSLAGLTLATILFMSVSVYAVQQQQPAPKQPKPAHSTRKHTVDSNSEYGMVDNKRIGYIIWKGQKLPITRVARLQRQLDRVMAGQLNLDTVKQPDRDILLTIIEKNNAFESGMDAVNAGLNTDLNTDLNAQGSARIDYNTIIKTAFDAVNSAGVFPVDVDNVLEEVKTINYNQIINDAMASVDTNIFYRVEGNVVKSGNTDEVRRYQQRQMDSLSQLMAQRSRQMQAIQLQIEKLRFPVEEVERQNEVLNWRKDKLMEQRNALIEKHQKLLYNNEKQKLSQAEVEKQVEALEPEIKKLEGSMEELNRQMEQSNAKQEELKIPMQKLEQEAQHLENQLDKLSDQMGRYGDKMALIVPPMPPMNIRVTPRPARGPRPVRVPRPAIAPTPPAHPNGLTIPSPAVPGAPRPKIATPAIPKPAPKP